MQFKKHCIEPKYLSFMSKQFTILTGRDILNGKINNIKETSNYFHK